MSNVELDLSPPQVPLGAGIHLWMKVNPPQPKARRNCNNAKEADVEIPTLRLQIASKLLGPTEVIYPPEDKENRTKNYHYYSHFRLSSAVRAIGQIV